MTPETLKRGAILLQNIGWYEELAKGLVTDVIENGVASIKIEMHLRYSNGRKINEIEIHNETQQYMEVLCKEAQSKLCRFINKKLKEHIKQFEKLK